MKLRLLLAFLSLAAAGAVFYVRAANSNAAASPAPTAASSGSCSECDGPSPASVLPNPYKTDTATAATPATPTTAAVPAKN